ncbi:MAG: efflux RND transporter periplasmic adaptor subunit [Planctomycetes bacterium]|nr:efflux RND transporter periplasmic adaptor subunit [Planctomycetota bacterium]
MSTKKTSGFRAWWLIVAAGIVVVWGGVYGGWFDKSQAAVVKGARVERGPLTISVLQRGNLAAKDAVSIKSEIEGQTTILWLIKEGTFVKPGDLLVELDASALTEKKVQQDISVQNAEAAYIKAKASYDIQASQNKSDIESADRKLMFADIDRKKYIEGDFEQLKKAADEKIKLAESELAKSKNTYDWSKNLSERGFLTKSELDRDELDYQRAQITLEQAQRARDLFVQYDDPRSRTELDANYREAERGLERARLQATSRLVDFESALSTSKSKFDLEREKLQRYVDQIAKAKITAKDAGMVVYARTEGGRMGGGDPIQEGTQVRERQEILTIPRTNGLIVEASVHESVLKRVTVGNRCKIRVDSIPDREFEGNVQFVALLADKNSWWANPNQRLYRTEIQVTNPTLEMRPGMSCSIEILADSIADCLSVPLQSIVLDKGKTTAFVVKGSGHEQREVKVGRSNDAKVEVLSGLTEGEEVLLAPPAGFTPQGAEEVAHNGPSEAATAGQPAMNVPSGNLPANGERAGNGPSSAGEGGARTRPEGASGEGTPRRRRNNPEGGAATKPATTEGQPSDGAGGSGRGAGDSDRSPGKSGAETPAPASPVAPGADSGNKRG